MSSAAECSRLDAKRPGDLWRRPGAPCVLWPRPISTQRADVTTGQPPLLLSCARLHPPLLSLTSLPRGRRSLLIPRVRHERTRPVTPYHSRSFHRHPARLLLLLHLCPFTPSLLSPVAHQPAPVHKQTAESRLHADNKHTTPERHPPQSRSLASALDTLLAISLDPRMRDSL
jgi:hypothetical protein